MDIKMLEIISQIAGIGGLSIGIFLFLCKEIIRKNIFPTLKKDNAYKLLMLISILSWSIALFGIMAWCYMIFLQKNDLSQKHNKTVFQQITFGNNSPLLYRTEGNVNLYYTGETK